MQRQKPLELLKVAKGAGGEMKKVWVVSRGPKRQQKGEGPRGKFPEKSHLKLDQEAPYLCKRTKGTQGGVDLPSLWGRILRSANTFSLSRCPKKKKRKERRWGTKRIVIRVGRVEVLLNKLHKKRGGFRGKKKWTIGMGERAMEGHRLLRRKTKRNVG